MTLVRLNTKIKRLGIDHKTKELLLKDAADKFKRSKELELEQIENMVDNVLRGSRRSMHPILRRCYIKPDFKENDYLKFFMNSHIDRWLTESVLTRVMKDQNGLYAKVKSAVRLQKLSFPEVKRELPSLMTFLGTNKALEAEQENKLIEIEPLPIELPDQTNEQEKMTKMLHQVLKLMNFLTQLKYLHTRKLASPVLQLPLRRLGDETPEFLQKSMLRKKLKYIRRTFIEYPPITHENAEYLTSLHDDLSSIRFADPTLEARIRTEYKAFIRKTYTIDNSMKITLNKYANIQPKKVIEDKYKQPIRF